MKVRSGILEVQPSVYVEYTEWVEDNARDIAPIVCVHGFGGSMELFVTFTFPALEAMNAKRFITLNLPGYGNSSSLLIYDISVYEKVLEDFLDASGITQCHMLGVSLGGSVILSFAAHHPKRALTVCAHEPVCCGIAQFSILQRMTVALLGSLPPFGKLIIKKALHLSWMPSLIGMFWNRSDFRLFDKMGGYREIASQTVRESSVGAFFGNLKSGINCDIRRDLVGLRVPALLTHGEKTTYRSLRSSKVASYLSSTLPCTVEIPHAGHLAPYSSPTAFVQEYINFLRRCSVE